MKPWVTSFFLTFYLTVYHDPAILGGDGMLQCLYDGGDWDVVRTYKTYITTNTDYRLPVNNWEYGCRM